MTGLFTGSIHHVAIIVSDYTKSKDFYVNKLGFEIVRENYRAERGDWKLDLSINGAELEIFAPNTDRNGKHIEGMPYPPDRVSRPEACGLRHLAFRVDNVDAAVANLKKEGIECEPVRTDDFTGEKLTFFADPDGLPIELHE